MLEEMTQMTKEAEANESNETEDNIRVSLAENKVFRSTTTPAVDKVLELLDKAKADVPVRCSYRY